jgi:hypothetical protein
VIDTVEVHPLEISFCDECGDFFARSDSLKRHCKNQPAKCLNITRKKADEKRRETQKAHDESVGRLEGCSNTGEDIGMPFSLIIDHQGEISRIFKEAHWRW